MSQSISFWKQEAQLLPRDHAMRNSNPNRNPNRNSNLNPDLNDTNPAKRNPNMNLLMHPH